MKKNRMMRLASVLLVCVLLTTSVISGTFAKYVTTDNGTDKARVAKWGVTIDVEGSLFENSYKNTPVTEENIITVKAYNSSDVVAPGTKNDNGMIITLKGKPEVDTEIAFTVTADKDVVLPAGTYKDYTSADETAEFTLTKEYRPVKFTLTNAAGTKVVDGGSLAAVETYLEGLNKIYQTNTDLAEKLAGNAAGTFKLTWEWVIDGDDRADTYLGNMAAGLVDTAPAGSSTEIEFTVTVTATQVD